jgi:hypothetical protein
MPGIHTARHITMIHTVLTFFFDTIQLPLPAARVAALISRYQGARLTTMSYVTHSVLIPSTDHHDDFLKGQDIELYTSSDLGFLGNPADASRTVATGMFT